MNTAKITPIETWTDRFTMHKNVYGEWYGLIFFTAFSIPHSTNCYESFDDTVDEAYQVVNEYIWNLLR